jgi:hypothetical protein
VTYTCPTLPWATPSGAVVGVTVGVAVPVGGTVKVGVGDAVAVAPMVAAVVPVGIAVTVEVAVAVEVAVEVGGMFVAVAVGGALVAVALGGTLVEVALGNVVAVNVANCVTVAVGACERVAVGVALGLLLLSPPQAETSDSASSSAKRGKGRANRRDSISDLRERYAGENTPRPPRDVRFRRSIVGIEPPYEPDNVKSNYQG